MNLLLQIFKNLLCIKKMGKVEIHVRISYDMAIKICTPNEGKALQTLAVLHKTKGIHWKLYRNIYMKYTFIYLYIHRLYPR